MNEYSNTPPDEGIATLIAAAEGLLAFIRQRYPDDFVEGGQGYLCQHHRKIDAALRAVRDGRREEPEVWGLSKWCSTGEHGWCANRSPEECHCTCECHPRKQREHDLKELARLSAKYPREAGPDGRRAPDWQPEEK